MTRGMLGKSNMALSTEQDGKASSTPDMDLLLHPELLSDEFLKLILNEKKINTRNTSNRDKLTEIYLRHVMPLPQRTLPSSRWGRSVARSRGSHTQSSVTHSIDPNRKRPLIVFDGTSSNSGPLKVKRPEGGSLSSGGTDRLKPPPNTNMASPVRKLTTVASKDTPNLKREAHNATLNSPTVKKKIQHVTWP